MCRLFGFKSIINSRVHTSLVKAENALRLQGEEHPDGWGVAYYINDIPHIIKSKSRALDSAVFQHIAQLLNTQTVIAHLRRATTGKVSILNTHPFQYGRWIFAHNGNIKQFAQLKQDLLNQIHPMFHNFIFGETDSEVLFYFFLTQMNKHLNINAQDTFEFKTVAHILLETVNDIVKIIGPLHRDDHGPRLETYLSFVISNGDILIGFNGGKNIYYSTYKNRCPQRDSCPAFNDTCEAPRTEGPVNHLILSSEPLSGENKWQLIPFGHLVGVDHRMNFHIITP